MRNRLRGLGVALAGAAVAAGGCSSTKACSEIGCGDSFMATIRRADGTFPSGAHRVEMLINAGVSMCTFTFPLPTAAGGDQQPVCPAPLSVVVLPWTTCREGT